MKPAMKRKRRPGKAMTNFDDDDDQPRQAPTSAPVPPPVTNPPVSIPPASEVKVPDFLKDVVEPPQTTQPT